MTKFTSDFAIVDIKRGRGSMRRLVDADKKPKVIIHGIIDAVHSKDDGVSQEFSITVSHFEVFDDQR